MAALSAFTLCLVVAISDGDTVRIRCNNELKEEPSLYTIRLAEIDAPEKFQPFGIQAKESLAKLCFHAHVKPVVSGTDKYGRLIAHISCQGIDASARLVQIGMAWAYPKYLRDASILAAQAVAKQNLVGLWKDSDAIPPWVWRACKHKMC